MFYEYRLKTRKQEFVDITDQIRKALVKSGITEGMCVVFCPHTTAGITINENTDPAVVNDMMFALDKTFPDHPEFQHTEGNSAAHMKASCIGSSVKILIQAGELVLGMWQGVFFCEFDGPRNRRFIAEFFSA